MSAAATTPPVGRRGPRRGFLRGLITSLLTIAIATLVLEVALRVVFARSMHFGLEMWKYARELKRLVSTPRSE